MAASAPPTLSTLEAHDAASADQALFGGALQGIVATLHRNERPLRGLVGLLDWRFHGLISRSIRNGVISGEPGECAYFPVSRNGVVFHLVLAGAGNSDAPGKRGVLPAQSLEPLRKNLASLKLAKIGISREDFGNPSDSQLQSQMKGLSVWIVP